MRQLIDRLADEVRSLPEEGPRRRVWGRRIKREVQLFGEKRLGWPQGYRDLLVSEDFYYSTVRFIRLARGFAPEISGTEVSQALRNVWIANSLQMLLDRPVSLTPAVFAYSMLYPYTDNFLDDPAISPMRKRTLNDRLGLWLAGEDAASSDPHQQAIRRLVRLIADQFDRRRFPAVFASLQAIHSGQQSSLLQQKSGSPLTASDLLAISVRKGGSSVLADGYLVAGHLDPAEEDFCMGYGVFLQFLDDLQDVQNDLRAGHQTLFTVASETGSLDAITGRLHHFMHSVVQESERFRARRFAPQRDLILRNCVVLLVGAVAENPLLFSGRFRNSLESRWPVRLRSMRRLRRRGERQFSRAGQALCQARGVASILQIL